jgi:hypothetical protein
MDKLAVFKTSSGIFEHIDAKNITVSGYHLMAEGSKMVIGSTGIPVDSFSSGAKGQITFDDNFLYICIDDNSWKSLPLQSIRQALTTSLFDSFIGDTTIQVPSTDGFTIGDPVVIDKGSFVEEFNTIDAFGSLKLKYPLMYDHPAGFTVTKIQEAEMSAPVWFEKSQSIDHPIDAKLTVEYNTVINEGNLKVVYDIDGDDKDLFAINSVGQLSFVSDDHVIGNEYKVNIIASNTKGFDRKELSIVVASALDIDGDGIPNTYDIDHPDNAGKFDTDGDGIINEADADNNLHLPDIDGDGVIDAYDYDDDGDGVPDEQDADHPDNAGKLDTDSDGVLDEFDLDDDGDGIPDERDADHPSNSGEPDTDSDGLLDKYDEDDDNDGIPDIEDASHPDNALERDVDGDDIIDKYDTDIDGDGVVNAIDMDDDGDGVPDLADVDSPENQGKEDLDGDGIIDEAEAEFNSDAVDTDGDNILDDFDDDDDDDGIPDAADPDDDGDNIADTADANHPNNLGKPDSDGDGILDVGDADINPDKRDSDGDNVIDEYDLDDDNDGTPDVSDSDDDGDGIPDIVDVDHPSNIPVFGDSDGDGIIDSADADNYPDSRNADGDGIIDEYDIDDDNDGILDQDDPDDDGDGIEDFKDADHPDNLGQPDSDGDGIIDAHDGIIVSVSGENSNNSGGGTFIVGDLVEISSSSNPGYAFSRWVFDVQVDFVEGTSETSSVAKFYVPAVESINVVSMHDLVDYTVSVTNGIAQKSVFNYGDTVNLSADYKEGYVFESWQADANITVQNDSFVMPASDVNIVANYSIIEYAVTVDGANGSTSVSTEDGTFNFGDTATLTAYPDEGYELSSWSVVNKITNQIGGDILGEAPGDESGYSVDVSSDGNTIVVGAAYNDGNGDRAGHVRVYQKDSRDIWQQIGSDIDGEASGDRSGSCVKISSNGEIIAIGAPFNDGSGDVANTGHVRIYENQGGEWTQVGGDIDGEFASDQSGEAIALNSDGSIIAIGAIGNDDTGSLAGHVRVYQRDQYNTDVSPIGWTQIGSDIDGEAGGDLSGSSVAINAAGNIVAIGAVNNDSGELNQSGHVRIFENQEGSWVQVGGDIDGLFSDDHMGTSVALSADGNIVAVGAYDPEYMGNVYVYERDESNTTESPLGWTQLGFAINLGFIADDGTAKTIDLNSQGDILAIGSTYSIIPVADSYEYGSGVVNLYKYDGAFWNKIAQVSGEVESEYNDLKSFAISADAGVVVIGTDVPDDITKPGRVRVYKREETIISSNNTFTVPAGNVDITANYIKSIYNVSLDGVNGSPSASTEDGVFNFGDQVTLNPNPDYGYTLDSWTVNNPKTFTLAGSASDLSLSQIGSDIVGIDGENEQLGFSVDLNSDGSIFVVGTANKGLARVYQRSGDGWSQFGSDLKGRTNGDYFGESVAISSDGLTIAVGAPRNVEVVSDTITDYLRNGYVSVFKYNGTDWNNIGEIEGTFNEHDETGEYSGSRYCLDINADGTVVAIGAESYDESASAQSVGRVVLYRYETNLWTEFGTFVGKASNVRLGSVGLDASGTIVAVGGGGNQTVGEHVSVWRYAETDTDSNIFEWSLIGDELSLQQFGDTGSYNRAFGESDLRLSDDGMILSVGIERLSNLDDVQVGGVKVFKFTLDDSTQNENASWSNGAWSQLGGDIYGENSGDVFGRSLSMSSDGLTILVGAELNDGAGTSAGHAQIYKYISNEWLKIAEDIDGHQAGDRSGYSVALSSDAKTLAIGAPYSEPTSSSYSNGRVKLYSISQTVASSFTMPASDVSITANYVEAPVVTLNVDEGGTASGGGAYSAGDTVTLTNSANSGMGFDGYEVVSGPAELVVASDGTFIMPDQQVTIRVKFVQMVAVSFMHNNLRTYTMVWEIHDGGDYYFNDEFINRKTADGQFGFTVYVKPGAKFLFGTIVDEYAYIGQRLEDRNPAGGKIVIPHTVFKTINYSSSFKDAGGVNDLPITETLEYNTALMAGGVPPPEGWYLRARSENVWNLRDFAVKAREQFGATLQNDQWNSYPLKHAPDYVSPEVNLRSFIVGTEDVYVWQQLVNTKPKIFLRKDLLVEGSDSSSWNDGEQNDDYFGNYNYHDQSVSLQYYSGNSWNVSNLAYVYSSKTIDGNENPITWSIVQNTPDNKVEIDSTTGLVSYTSPIETTSLPQDIVIGATNSTGTSTLKVTIEP